MSSAGDHPELTLLWFDPVLYQARMADTVGVDGRAEAHVDLTPLILPMAQRR